MGLKLPLDEAERIADEYKRLFNLVPPQQVQSLLHRGSR